MINQQMLDYIKQQLGQGVSQEQIKSSLMTNGWQQTDIEQAFASISGNQAPLPPSQIPNATQASLLGATEIFGQAWSIYKKKILTFFGIAMMPVLLIIALSVVMSLVLIIGRVGVSVLPFAVFFVVIVMFIGQTWAQIAQLYVIKDSQEKIGIKEAYRRSWPKIISYWWVVLLVLFITMGGFFLFVIPGIIFSMWFSLAMFVFIAEDVKGMNSLLKSREYVRGKWWNVFWKFLFIGIISMVISLVVSFILGFVSAILGFDFGNQISQLVLMVFLIPLAMTYSFLVYSNLRAVKGEFAFASTGGNKAVFIFLGIIGVLTIPALLFATVFFASLNSAREEAFEARQQFDLDQIKTGLEIYHDTNSGKYPISLDMLFPKYLSNVPVDPFTEQSYEYQLQQNGMDYEVCTELSSMRAQKCVTSQS